LWQINTIDTGLQIDEVLAFQTTTPARPPDQTRRFITDALAAIETIPGVTQSAYATHLPPEARLFGYLSLGAGALPDGVPSVVGLLPASKDYFTMLGLTVRQGRAFADTDDAAAPPIAVVNESFVRTYLDGGPDPIGSTIELSTFSGGREIVGVVNDVRNLDPRIEPIPFVYLPYQQANRPFGTFAVRATVPLESLIPTIRARLNEIDPSIPLQDFNTLEDRLLDSLDRPRFNAVLAASCAILAVLFVTIGLYGAISYMTSRRTLEFGVRAAIGAQPESILTLVLCQSARMAFTGVVIGAVFSIAVTRSLASLLFQVPFFDPISLGFAIVLVAAVAISASLIPAIRASRISPVMALRYE
jgi:putative ABC transport system permease protein